MEEDTAHDVYKCIVTKHAEDFSTIGVAHYKDATFNAKISLHSNVLSCSATDDAHAAQVPLIFVLERATVRKLDESVETIVITFPHEDERVRIVFDSEATADKWMFKIVTCTHQMARAQLDELAYKFYTMSVCDGTSPGSPTHSFHNYYLTNPHRITHNFAISQQNSLPSRRIILDECMWESKLSMILPAELIKTYRKWISEFCYLLESKQKTWPSFAIPALHDVLREIKDNIEVYEQCHEFMANYTGPSFRKSVEKHRVAFGSVPTNLHLQVFGQPKEKSREILSCGTASAIPFRFQNGGLQKIFHNLEVDPVFQHSSFWSKRQIVLDLKKSIGELSHKLDVDWKLTNFGKPDKVCIEINSGIKQMYETLRDTMLWISGIEQCAEILLEEERLRVANGAKVDIKIPDSLQNQVDSLEAMIISLNTKIAVIDTLDDEQKERKLYEKSARDAMSKSLDYLLMFADSILEAQLFGLVLALHRSSVAHLYYSIEIRADFVLSQCITIAATAILSRVHEGWVTVDCCDLLLVVFSFLSAYGDEKGMAEDAIEGWKMLENRVQFRLVRAPSTVCRNCIPLINGGRTSLNVSIPLPHEMFDNLPEILRKTSFKVRPAYFNIGVNHEATLGQSFGGLAFESAINQEGADNVNSFANRLNCGLKERETVMELVNAVSVEPSRKNLAIFDWAMAASEALNGRSVVCCKSGKDRTGMGVTLDQGRVLRENCGLNASQVFEVVSALRKDGVRRENCKKNVGKAMYSFSPFQMHFLPKSFRPPNGTYAQGVAS